MSEETAMISEADWKKWNQQELSESIDEEDSLVMDFDYEEGYRKLQDELILKEQELKKWREEEPRKLQELRQLRQEVWTLRQRLDWEKFTKTEYYNRAKNIMCETMGEGDVENILATVWEMGRNQKISGWDRD
jgi:hypothetical protein